MFGHRPDGRRIKSLDPLFYVVPYIMPKRTDAHVFYEMSIDIEPLNKYVKEKKAVQKNISHMSVIMAAMGKVLSEYPQLNRFVVARKVYARNVIDVCYAIVHEFGPTEPEETVVKAFFENGDTVFTVADKIDALITNSRTVTDPSGTDKLLASFFKLPHCFVGGLIRFLLWLDRRGMLSKSFVDMSPFHASMYVTNLASLGIGSVFHHIYDAGNVSMFLSMGKRGYEADFDKNGIEQTKRKMNFKFAIDERICSGYVYSRAFRLFQKYIANPELLEEPIKIKEDVR